MFSGPSWLVTSRLRSSDHADGEGRDTVASGGGSYRDSGAGTARIRAGRSGRAARSRSGRHPGQLTARRSGPLALRALTAAVGAIAVCAALLQAAPEAAAAVRKAPTPAQTKPVPVSAVTSHYQQPKAMPAYQPGAVTWPSGHADVSLVATSGAGAGTDAGTGGAGTSGSGATVTVPVRAGSLPVWIGPADSGHSAAGGAKPNT